MNELRNHIQLAALLGPTRARAVLDGDSVRSDERNGTLAGFQFFAAQLWHPPESWPGVHYPYRQYHWEWARLCLQKRHCGIMAPRGHGKTTRIGAPLVAWWAIHHPDQAMLVTSATPALARATVRGIAERLAVEWWADGVPGPGWVYPGLLDHVLTGHPADVLFSTRRVQRPDPNIRGAGIMGEGITGFHWDAVLADDVVGEENARTRGKRDRLSGFWSRKLLPSLTGGKRLWRLFTLYHPNDLNAESVRNGLPVCAGYRSAVRGDLHSADAEVLDPNYFTLDALREMYDDIGPVAFALQFRNDAAAAEGAFFRLEWLEAAAQDCDPPDSYERIVLTGDLAYTDSADADYTALVVAGKAADGRYYLLDLTRHRYDAIDLVADEIARLHRRWKPHVVGVECGPGAMSQIHRQLELHLRDRGIAGLRRLRHQSKTSAAAGLQSRLRSGVWRIPSAPGGVYAALRDELLTFPYGDHDDMVDALAYADIELTGPRQHRRAPRVEHTRSGVL